MDVSDRADVEGLGEQAGLKKCLFLLLMVRTVEVLLDQHMVYNDSACKATKRALLLR
jgi:hypothetical protein